MHRIDNSRDRNFWSVRVNADVRIILHKTEASLLLAYVDHHDKAYAWAARRRIEAHPKTGVVQIVEVRERVEELAQPSAPTIAPRAPAAQSLPFARLSNDDLLSVGVPTDWLADIRAASEDAFLELSPHLPAEAAESLLQFATSGILNKPAPAPADPYAHPDALRRFRVIENVEELAQALDSPWDKWMVFLHPSQREIVEKDFAGPARVAGSAGTGKTIVALHRAVRLAKSSPDARGCSRPSPIRSPRRWRRRSGFSPGRRRTLSRGYASPLCRALRLSCWNSRPAGARTSPRTT